MIVEVWNCRGMVALIVGALIVEALIVEALILLLLFCALPAVFRWPAPFDPEMDGWMVTVLRVIVWERYGKRWRRHTLWEIKGERYVLR